MKRKTPFSPTADAVEAPSVDLEERAAALVDDEVGVHLLRVLLAEPAGAEVGAELLVGGDDHLQLSARGAPARARQVSGGRDLGRDLVLHVLAAATLDEAVDDVAGPGAERPLVGVRRERCPCGEMKASTGPSALPERRAITLVRPGSLLEQLDLEARVAQDRGHVLLSRAARCRAG